MHAVNLVVDQLLSRMSKYSNLFILIAVFILAIFDFQADVDIGIDLASILAESIVWIAGRLGPLLTAKHFSSRILQTMKDCYSVPSAFTIQTGIVHSCLSSSPITYILWLIGSYRYTKNNKN